jgi:hypothetical protein
MTAVRKGFFTHKKEKPVSAVKKDRLCVTFYILSLTFCILFPSQPAEATKPKLKKQPKTSPVFLHFLFVVLPQQENN